MPEDRGNLETIAAVAAELEAAGHPAVLVGGMALVIHGSDRVTRDFDLLLSVAGRRPDQLIEVAYRNGFELVTKFSESGEALRSIDNVRIAVMRANQEKRDSLLFRHPGTGQRLDLLLDFPVPCAEVLVRATRIKTKGGDIRIAVMDDLLRMKELAFADRKSAKDAQDLEFLRKILKRKGRRARLL